MKSNRLVIFCLTIILTVSIFIVPMRLVYADLDSFLGETQLFPYGFEPRGWMECKGQVLSIQQNTALFSLLGTNFGGNGTSTFAIPDLRGMSPTNQVKYYICMEGTYPYRDGGGNSDFVGQIKMFPYNFDPSGYIRCDGRTLNIDQNDVLFSLVGTTYGGDGTTNFKVPDMRKMEINKYIRYCINPFGLYPTQN